MTKVKVEWLDGQVEVPALGKIIKTGDQLHMDAAEARDREAAGQVKIVNQNRAKGE